MRPPPTGLLILSRLRLRWRLQSRVLRCLPNPLDLLLVPSLLQHQRGVHFSSEAESFRRWRPCPRAAETVELERLTPLRPNRPAHMIGTSELLGPLGPLLLCLSFPTARRADVICGRPAVQLHPSPPSPTEPLRAGTPSVERDAFLEGPPNPSLPCL